MTPKKKSNPVTRLFTKTSILTATLLFATSLIKHLSPEFYLPVFPYAIVFVALITSAVLLALIQSATEPNKLMRRVMGFTGLKLMFFLAFIVIYLLMRREDAKVFIVFFLLIYAIFTVFDVLQLLKILSPPKKEEE